MIDVAAKIAGSSLPEFTSDEPGLFKLADICLYGFLFHVDAGRKIFLGGKGRSIGMEPAP
jgi:hypothetical protein